MSKHVGLGRLLEVEMLKKCTPLWCEAHVKVKMYKTSRVRSAYGNGDVEKVHAVVAQNTFSSQHVQNTPRSDDFWKLRGRKNARRCGANHFLSQNVEITRRSDPLFDDSMAIQCRKNASRCAAKMGVYISGGGRTPPLSSYKIENTSISLQHAAPTSWEGSTTCRSRSKMVLYKMHAAN